MLFELETAGKLARALALLSGACAIGCGGDFGDPETAGPENTDVNV